jgi:uncharacterized membrane protein
MGWLEFAAAFLAFFGGHGFLSRPPLRARLVAAFGTRGYLIGHSFVSAALFLWLIGAAQRAPYVELWAPAPWQAWAPMIAMPFAVTLAALSVGAPNPFSFGGARNETFDPLRPGIVGATRHPLLWAMILWAGAHLVPNGDLAHALLFGASLALALIGMRALDARARRRLGAEEWERLARTAPLIPSLAALARMGAPSLRRLIAAGAIFLILLAGHPWFAGVSPLPV